MLIAVNTRFLLHNKLEGIGRFTYETLSRITQAHPEHQFLFLFDRKHHPEFVFSNNVTPIELFPQARHPFLYYLWFEFAVASALKKYKPDVFLSTDGYLSLRSDVPQVPVFHDLAFIHYPEGISFWEKKYYNHFFPRYAKKAQRIVAVSGFTKQDIVKQYQIDEDKIDVVYNAPATGFKPVNEQIKLYTQQQFAQGQPYFCYVGALHPRKNIDTLLKAFDEFKRLSGSSFKLLIVGRKAWLNESIETTYNTMQFKQDVIFTGRVPENDLYHITASAHAMVYIPLFEGFGLPLVEAMACDVPVITSDVSSMPEVAGDAGILVSPLDHTQTAQAMLKLVNDENFYRQKKLASAKRKLDFSWDVSAAQLWQSILKTTQP